MIKIVDKLSPLGGIMVLVGLALVVPILLSGFFIPARDLAVYLCFDSLLISAGNLLLVRSTHTKGDTNE